MPIKVNDKKLQKKLDDLNDALTDRKSQFLMGKYIVGLIVERTRGKGQGVKRTGANASKLKNVSDAWAARRAKLPGKSPKAATGKKSNLTFRAKMLDNLNVLSVGTTKGVIIGYPDPLQADKAEGNEKRGRPFMYLSRGEITKASDFLKKQILK